MLFFSSTGNGRPLHPDSVTGWMKRLPDKYPTYNLPKTLHPHGFRHSYASVLIAEDIPVVEIAESLGHASTDTTTKIYAHMLERKNRAVQAHIGNAYNRSKDIKDIDLKNAEES